MGLMINTNVASLRAQTALKQSTKKLQQAMTRLSTGLRINTGSDDVVGLARSESLRTRIRGIGQARANVNSASSVLGVAEGYLSQMTSLAQQLREVAVQAADGTLSSSDRSSLTDRFSAMMNEYNRLATNSNFNGVKLLDGTFSSKTIQVGSEEVDTLAVTINDSRSSAIGKIAIMTSAIVTFATTSINAAAMSFGDPSGLTVAGTTIATSAFSSDGVSYTDADESAIAYVNAINAYSGTTGVTAQVLANTVTMNYSNGTTLDATQFLIINGVTIKSTAVAYDTTSDNDVAALVDLINSKSSQTGVAATQNSGSNKLILTAADGRNIDMTVTTSGTNNTTVTANVFGALAASTLRQISYRGQYKLYSSSAFAVTGGTAEFGLADTTYALDSSTTLDDANVVSASNAGMALTILDNVLIQLQSRRASVGTTINRLENSEDELSSRMENLSSAESSIRDADIAEETAKMTQANILQQAGVAVLSQANTTPQIALQLLQNL